MRLEGAVWCILIIAETAASYDASCPEICYCNMDFTYCSHKELTTLPLNIDPSVSSLDLSYNKLTVIPSELNGLTSLVHLNLSHNQIWHFDYNLVGLANLHILDLSFNQITNWKNIHRSTFTTLPGLTFLDLSHNLLGNNMLTYNPLEVPSLEILHLSNCSISILGSNIFVGLPKIIELHASLNPITLLDAVFVSETLKFLDISESRLRRISKKTIANLTSLETFFLRKNTELKEFHCQSQNLLYLDLSNCNLDLAPTQPLPALTRINLHGNRFRVIPNHSFNFTKLEILDLSYNTLESISNSAFQGLPNLQSIDLSQNTLHDLHPFIFLPNTKLKFLNISRNHFNSFVEFASNSLEVLDISSCEIQTIEKDSLVQMPNLQMLSLSKNILKVFPDYFQGASVMSLDASLCRIKSLNNKTFQSMTSLRHLNLHGNRLTTTYPDYFTYVTLLNITDNPWTCDCDKLKDMFVWMTKTGKSIDTLYCQSPEQFEGLSWMAACQSIWQPELNHPDTVWWYSTGLIVTVFVILIIILSLRRVYMLKEKRLRQETESRRAEERDRLRIMRRMQLESREEESRNAPDPREIQPPPYNEALLLPRLDASHPSLAGSLHSIASKNSLYGSNPDVTKRGRPRRKRRRRKSDSSEGQRASRVVNGSDTSENERPQPRPTLESDF